ncbi:hypothetical protein HDU87_003536 [Geranomyces variabilis]|uniref:Uncharacterized protein n=1 Tax=Geranomyces variabilis TaxID=109894 RepID=A0AAD5TJL9_9FUNG|nr:hypothetical protein HDU87_003536 [Geranomyces variabilis]
MRLPIHSHNPLLLAACVLAALIASVHAFIAPNISTWTGPLTAMTNPGDASVAATNPFNTRYATALDTNRVAILLPAYASTPYWMGVVHGLRIIGVPAKVVSSTTVLSTYSVAIIYTGTEYSWAPSTADVTNLRAFVLKGGHLVAMSNVPASLSSIFGVTSTKEAAGGTRAATTFVNVETTPTVLKGFNFTEPNEYIMSIWDDSADGGFQTVGYLKAQTTPAVTILANYYRRLVDGSTALTLDTSTSKAAVTVYQPAGYAGFAYAIGIDVGYWYFRAMSENTQIGYSYIGLYSPGYDTILRILKNIFLRTSDFMTLWPVPYNKGLAFLTTWDLDTAVAYPHTLAIATTALQAGAVGNANLHTKYTADAYETAYFQYGVPYVYQMTGFPTDAAGKPTVEFASHSVSHSPNANQFPIGSPSIEFIKAQNVSGAYFPFIYVCDPTLPNGVPWNGITCLQGGAGSNYSFWTLGGNIMGEVRVSKYLIDTMMATYNISAVVQTYRPGNLAYATTQGQVAAALGIIGGSSCANNNHNTHLPFHVTHNREQFAEIDNYEFPLTISDGDMNMSSSFYPNSSLQQQSSRAKQIAQYGGLYTILIHPSDIMFDKIQLQSALHDEVRPYAYFTNTSGMAWFWRGRDYVEYSHTTVGTVVTAPIVFQGPVDGLTVQVPKTWILATVSAGYTACQAVSYDTTTYAVVFRSTQKGTATLTFNIKAAGTAPTLTCPDFTPARNPQCLGFEVLVSSFMSTYTENRKVNELILDSQGSPNLFTQYTIDGRLLIQTDAGPTSYSTKNNWYSTLSKFCFDISLYTTVTFDLVAPVGSDFFVSLVSSDSACVTPVSTTTYVRVSDYVPMDGRNHTVNIPIADLNPTNSKYVQTLLFSNLSPGNAAFWIDNVIVKRRCVFAPGENYVAGTVIDNFASIGRWVTGINTLGGATDTVGMRYARMPFLNSLILEPASAASYFYSNFNGVYASAGTTDLVISVSGPVGGMFDAILSSGAGGTVTSTVSSSVAGKLSANSTVLWISLSNFTGVDLSQAYGLKLTNFSPFTAGSKFTINYISFAPRPGTPGTTVARPAPCVPAAGTPISDLCSYKEFVEGVNQLGGKTGDDSTAGTYVSLGTPKSGRASIGPIGNTTYWYTTLGAGNGCYDASTKFNAIQLKIAGPAGATARVVVKAGTAAGCKGASVSYAGTVTFTGMDTPVLATVPITGVTGLNPAYIQSVYVDSWSQVSATATYEIYYASLLAGATTNTPLTLATSAVSTPVASSCLTCMGTIVGNWCGMTAIPATNILGGYTNDDGTMKSQFLGSGGTLQLVPVDTTSYWYTLLTTSACYSAGTNNGLQIIVNAPAGSSFDIALRYKTDTGCTTTGPVLTVNSATYATFDGINAKNLTIPFTDFKGLDPTRLASLSLQKFTAARQAYSFSCVSLAKVTASIGTPLCSACPAPAVLDYCTAPAANANALGGVSGDDGTMATPPAVTGNSIALVPKSGSYWYTNIACVDYTYYKYLYITATLPAGASFNVEIQTSAATTAGCPAGSPIARADVSTTPYLTSTTSTAPQNITIPLTAFRAANAAIDPTRVVAISFSAFAPADGVSKYTVSCAFWSRYGVGGAMKKRRARGYEEENEDVEEDAFRVSDEL